MTLKRNAHVTTSGVEPVLGLLWKLGLDRRVYAGGVQRPLKARKARFWNRAEHEILDTLSDARSAYRARLKALRAERPEGHPMECSLHDIWRRLEHIFQKRGYELI